MESEKSFPKKLKNNELIRFYKNVYPANNNEGYYFNDIINWDDYKLEVHDDYIQWLFPDNTGGDNPSAPKLTDKDIKKFRKDPILRNNVVKATLRMLLFYGFTISEKNIKIKNIGLYSRHNYKRISRILNFLVKIDMEYLSAIFFLGLCKRMKRNDVFFNDVSLNYSFKKWMSTQPFLVSYVGRYNVNKLKSDRSNLENECKRIRGLNYTGNSCYMDSTLLCLFAIPNKTITNNILKKDLNTLKNIDRNLWSNCHSNINEDIKRRKDIQKSLNNITKSIRELNDVKYCSNLRSLIKNCPGAQEFHGTDPQDAGEFLLYLFNLFQVDVSKSVRKTYGTNDLGENPEWVLVSKIKDYYDSPIVNIVSTTLQSIKKGYDITKFRYQKQDSILDIENLWIPDKQNPDITYIRRKETFKIEESPILIFNLSRTYGEMVFTSEGEFQEIKTRNIWKRIKAPEKMTIKGKTLYLTGIVVHTGGLHYIANFKCQDEWYWYDDNPSGNKHEIKHIGTYDKMLKTNPNPLKYGTLYFYT
jgi:ubiquitin C-terminal hydrolase